MGISKKGILRKIQPNQFTTDNLLSLFQQVEAYPGVHYYSSFTFSFPKKGPHVILLTLEQRFIDVIKNLFYIFQHYIFFLLIKHRGKLLQKALLDQKITFMFTSIYTIINQEVPLPCQSYFTNVAAHHLISNRYFYEKNTE